MKITKSNIILTCKPKGTQEVGKIKVSITNRIDVDMDQMCDIVLSNTFNCSDAYGIKTTDWVSQQVFGLDFDSGFTQQDFITRCSINNIIPNIIYSTYSDSPQLRKFRALFILEDPITEFMIAKHMMLGLLKLFPEADGSCKDNCRMYYPGKQLLGRIDTLNCDRYFESICLTYASQGNDRYLQQLFPSIKSRSNRGQTTIANLNDPSNILYKNRQSILYNIDKLEKYKKRPTLLERFDYIDAFKEIKILDQFFNENVRVSHSILLGLATNLQYIEGGILKMLDRMKYINSLGKVKYIPETMGRVDFYPEEYFTFIRSVKRFDYLPFMLKTFSPYEDDHEIHNILVLGMKKGDLVKLREQELIELKDAERVMRESFYKALVSSPFTIEYDRTVETDPMFGTTYSSIIPKVIDSDIFTSDIFSDTNVYAFKLPTAIGKTQLVESLPNTLLAFPSHNLKEEVSNRMNVSHCVTPRYATYSVQIINDTLNNYTECDLFTESSELIHSIAKNKCIINKNKIVLTSDDIDAAREFMAENSMCRTTSRTVLTTHTRALYDSSFLHKTIIFDEDPLQHLMKIGSCLLDFSKFLGTKYQQFTEELRKYLVDLLGTGYVDEMKLFDIPHGFRQFCASLKRGDIIQILESKYVFKDFHDQGKVNFCRMKELPKDKRIIIMSATLPINIYKKLYGERLKVVDISNVKQIGTVEQWTKRSFSVTSMTGKKQYSPKVYEELYNVISGTPVITHLKAKNKFNKDNWCDYYFGNCAGFDTLNGQDISIVGTPNKPEFVYLFYAKLLGISNNNDFGLESQVVEWNDFRFRFFTYRNEELRDIQLSLIESELLQACGRNRTLRNACKTNVFSSLPLMITKKFNIK